MYIIFGKKRRGSLQGEMAGAPCIFLNQDINENIFIYLQCDDKRRMRLVSRAWRRGVDARVTKLWWGQEKKATELDVLLASQTWPNAESLEIVKSRDVQDQDQDGSIIYNKICPPFRYSGEAPTDKANPYGRLRWPCLKEMAVCGDEVTSECMLDVLLGSFPCLESLKLEGEITVFEGFVIVSSSPSNRFGIAPAFLPPCASPFSWGLEVIVLLLVFFSGQNVKSGTKTTSSCTEKTQRKVHEVQSASSIPAGFRGF
jgi:hypothetical protein